MTVRINFRFPTYLDAMHDSDRVLGLIRHSVVGKSNEPSVTVYEREERDGGGFGWFFTCGPVSVSCRAITRYTVAYHTPTGSGHHSVEFDGMTAEQCLDDLRAYLEAQLIHMRLGLAIIAGPK